MKPRIDGPILHEYPAGVDPSENLPPIDWTIGRTAFAGGLGQIIGPPDASKSQFILLRAVSVITGRPLTGELIHKRGKAFVYNAEDDIPTMLKRVRGICLRFGIDPLEVFPNIILASGQEHEFIAAFQDETGVKTTQAVTVLTQELKDIGVVYACFDPLVELQEDVEESGNSAMKKVAAIFRRMAHETGIAIELVHHVPKSEKKSYGDMMAGRGAGSVVGAVRWAITVMPVDKGDKIDKVIVQRPMIRVDVAKGNYAKRGAPPRYFNMVSVSIGNGDEVGVHELISEPLFSHAESEATAKRSKLAEIIIKAMGSKDEVALSLILPAVEKELNVGNRTARENVNDLLPVNEPQAVRLSDGALWDLTRRQPSDNRPNTIVRFRVSNGEGTINVKTESGPTVDETFGTKEHEARMNGRRATDHMKARRAVKAASKKAAAATTAKVELDDQDHRQRGAA